MVQHKPTPEEQLLKLIENPNASQPAEQAASGATPKSSGILRKGWGWGRFLGAWGYWKKQRQAAPSEKGPRIASPFSYIRGANMLLIAGVLAALIYLALDFSILKTDANDYLGEVSTAETLYPSHEEKGFLTNRPDVQHYQEMVSRRNPFVSPLAQVVEDEEPSVDLGPVGEEIGQLAQKIQKISLVGISWSPDYPLAMIEDKDSGRTFFLREGQEIQGIKVQKIDREKVTVTYEGEQAELV